jgi:oligoribonuclease NrnB/cAMP/cGMP phosphodiesterase (DHH superfamily)
MRVICFYHGTDFDGKCSAAIVKLYYPECELIPLDHGIAFPWQILHGGETVFMVDYTLKPFDEMLRLDRLCAHLTWIDHHEIVKEIKARQDVRIAGFRETSEAACELTWQYFFYRDLGQTADGRPIPRAVRLLGEYDSWRFEGDEALAFQYGLRQWEGAPDDIEFWRNLFAATDEEIDKIIDQGRSIFAYTKQLSKRFMQSGAFDVVFGGYRGLALNVQYANSQMFESMWDTKKYDIMIAFSWRNGCWYVTLYADRPEVNVRELAQRFGGDGHVKAAGFQCDKLPFLPDKS